MIMKNCTVYLHRIHFSGSVAPLILDTSNQLLPTDKDITRDRICAVEF